MVFGSTPNRDHTAPLPAYRVFGESGPVLVTRAVFATVDWLQFWELAK